MKKKNEVYKSFVSEPAVAYGYSGSKKASLQVLLSDKFKLIKLIQDGVSYKYFEKLKALFPFSPQDWSSFLDISLKSLQRYQKEQRSFKPIHSEKLLELSEVLMYGMEVFEDFDNLRTWLEAKSIALGSHRPLDLIKNSYGKELVMRELVAIEHGVFA